MVDSATYRPSVGDLVNVQSRTWPGINKPGGVGRVTKVHYENDLESSNDEDTVAESGAVLSVDVKYVLGGEEKNVDTTFIEKTGLELDRSSRRSRGSRRPESAEVQDRRPSRSVQRRSRTSQRRATTVRTAPPTPSPASSVAAQVSSSEDDDDDDDDEMDQSFDDRAEKTKKKRSRSATIERRDESSGTDHCGRSSSSRDLTATSKSTAYKRAKDEANRATSAKDETADGPTADSDLPQASCSQATVSTQDSSSATKTEAEKARNNRFIASEDGPLDGSNTEPEAMEHQSSASLAAMDDKENNAPKKDDFDVSMETETSVVEGSRSNSLATKQPSSLLEPEEAPTNDVTDGTMKMETSVEGSQLKAPTTKKRSPLLETYLNATDEAARFVEAVKNAPVASISSEGSEQPDELFDNSRYKRFVSLLNAVMCRVGDGMMHIEELVTKVNNSEAKGEGEPVVDPLTVGIPTKGYTEEEIRPFLNRLEKENRIMLTDNASTVYMI